VGGYCSKGVQTQPPIKHPNPNPNPTNHPTPHPPDLHTHQVGLVDELGGIARAIQLAKQSAGLSEEPGATELLEWPARRVPPALALLKSSGGWGGLLVGLVRCTKYACLAVFE